MATAPKSTLNAPQALGLAPDDAAYDALTELFLGDTAARASRSTTRVLPALVEESEEDRPAAPAPRTTVEALVMGHLPFRSGPWASQYARAVAREEKCRVGLVRMLSGETSVDVFGPPSLEAPNDLVGTLQAAIAWAAERVDRWMVQADDLDAPIVAGKLSVAKVTLLTGVNETAIVAAYQIITDLSKGQAALRARPRLRVAMIGATEERAQRVGAKIQRTAAAFLNQDVELGPSVGKVGPSGGVMIHRGVSELSAVRMIEMLSALPTAPPEQPAQAPAVDIRESVAEEVDSSEPAPPVLTADPEKPTTGVEAPAPAQDAAPVERTSQRLTEHVQGLVALEARCPDDEQVELGVDATGRLHLLRDGGDEHALSNLMMVNAWAKRHAKLLRMAMPQIVRADETPVLHLFTPNAKLGRTIGESGVQLHLLAPVHVGDKTAWYCTELN